MKTLLVVLASGAMWFFSTGVNHFWPLAWLAPLPLLVILPELRGGRAALAVFAAFAIGSVNLILTYDLPPIVLGLAMLLLPLPFVVVASIWRVVARRTSPGIAIVAYPALVVAKEYLVSLISPHGTLGNLAYSQADLLPLVQLAAVTGLWGISFLVSLVPAALAMAWRCRREPRIVYLSLAGAALPLALAMVWGAARLASPLPGAQTRIGLAASDAAVDVAAFETQDASDALPVIQAYAERAAKLADRGAQVIVLPEKFVGVTPAYEENARAILAAVALQHRVTIVAGFNSLGRPDLRNRAVVFGPDGGVALEYDKVHLVPGFEQGYRSGAKIGLVAGAAQPTGVAICKDLDFVPLGRAYAHAGVGLLLVPAWDFVKDGWVHSRMAVLRGVEGGYAVARSAAKGLLTVSDARGRILVERVSSAAPEVLVTAVVPIGRGGTFYSRTGDWFAWLCTAVAFAAVGASVRGRRPR